jgi:alpha-tubulin suppressor-like RCC1 family protein
VRVECDSCRILSRAWPGPSTVDTTGTFWIRKVKSVAAGGYHSMFLLTNGTVWAAGKNNSGRLGDGTYEMRTSPVRVMQDGQPMTDVEEIYGGGSGALFVKKNRDLYGVGSPASQITDPTNYQLANPVRMGGNVSKISFWDNAIWTTPQGTVMGFAVSPSWYEDTVIAYAEKQIMYDIASRIPWSGVVDVANGYSAQYILDSRRGLYAGTDGMSDSLQKNTYPFPFSVVVYNLPGSLKHIEADWYGRLYGINETGGLYELMQTGKSDSLSAVEVYKSPKAYALGTTLYVLTSDGKVLGRGTNDYGQLGTGSSSQIVQTDFSQVFPDQSQAAYTQISTGYTHVLALRSDGSVSVVGGNEHGQLCNGTTLDQYTPIPVNF